MTAEEEAQLKKYLQNIDLDNRNSLHAPENYVHPGYGPITFWDKREVIVSNKDVTPDGLAGPATATLTLMYALTIELIEVRKMAVGFKVKYYWYQVGHGDFVHSFFSTISYHLEQNGWGTEFPYLLNDLYHGKLENKNIDSAKNELEEIKRKLQNYSPSQVIWDIEDLSKRSPWGDNISKDITN